MGGLLLFVSSAQASTPRVLVSVPALHSLVSSLMGGVQQPGLLLDDPRAADVALDPFQSSRLITADLVIWSGPGMEKSLAEQVERLPAIENKMLTLSNTVPLLYRRGHELPYLSRKDTRDHEFWQDPRLAIMAVRRITPILVRIDPDNQERYLDNEIALLSRLKGLEKKISTFLSPYGGVQAEELTGFNQYFVHRFATAEKADSAFRKVSMTAKSECGPERANLAQPGQDLYFDLMTQAAQALKDCLERQDPKRTAGHTATAVRADSA